MAFEAHRRGRPDRTRPADDRAESVPPRAPLVAVPIDVVADAALACERARTESAADTRCDVCERALDGEPAGRGLLLTTRGDEVRYEEPALCATCATAIGLRAHLDDEIEEEEG